MRLHEKKRGDSKHIVYNVNGLFQITYTYTHNTFKNQWWT